MTNEQKVTNCPNCGSNDIKDGVCSYCGTILNDDNKDLVTQQIYLLRNFINNAYKQQMIESVINRGYLTDW